MVERKQVEQDWQARGFSCDLWVDPPGQEWVDFVHEVDEVVTLVEGEIEMEMQGKTFRPPVGEEIFIPAHTSHTVRNVGGVTARWLYGYRRR